MHFGHSFFANGQARPRCLERGVRYHWIGAVKTLYRAEDANLDRAVELTVPAPEIGAKNAGYCARHLKKALR